MEQKHSHKNIEPLDESELKESIDHELLSRDKKKLAALNKKVHEGGEAEPEPDEPTNTDYRRQDD